MGPSDGKEKYQINVRIFRFGCLEGWISGRMLALDGGDGPRAMRVFLGGGCLSYLPSATIDKVKI